MTITPVPRRKPALRPSKEMGAFVKRLRERRKLRQIDVAAVDGDMDNFQVSRVEQGLNVEVQFYERIAKVFKFRNALQMFMSGGDDETRRLLQLWKALPDDEARKRTLSLLRKQIDADEEPVATSDRGQEPARRESTARTTRRTRTRETADDDA